VLSCAGLRHGNQRTKRKCRHYEPRTYRERDGPKMQRRIPLSPLYFFEWVLVAPRGGEGNCFSEKNYHSFESCQGEVGKISDLRTGNLEPRTPSSGVVPHLRKPTMFRAGAKTERFVSGYAFRHTVRPRVLEFAFMRCENREAREGALGKGATSSLP
jgi:hypothetical protein